jgi:hypothetical protein
LCCVLPIKFNVCFSTWLFFFFPYNTGNIAAKNGYRSECATLFLSYNGWSILICLFSLQIQYSVSELRWCVIAQYRMLDLFFALLYKICYHVATEVSWTINYSYTVALILVYWYRSLPFIINIWTGLVRTGAALRMVHFRLGCSWKHWQTLFSRNSLHNKFLSLLFILMLQHVIEFTYHKFSYLHVIELINYIFTCDRVYLSQVYLFTLIVNKT